MFAQAQRLRKADPEKYGRIWASLERREKSPKAMFQHTVVKPVRMVLCEPILQVVTVRLRLLLKRTLSHPAGMASNGKFLALRQSVVSLRLERARLTLLQLSRSIPWCSWTCAASMLGKAASSFSVRHLSALEARAQLIVRSGTGLGAVLGGIANVFIPPGYHDFSRRWKGSPPPEQRLRGAMIGAILLVLSLLFFGWTAAYARISWS